MTESIEDKIRSVAFQKRIRIEEFFQDFDTLRSGYVSIDQFARCLSMLGVQVTQNDFKSLVDKYLDSSKQKIDYPRFSVTIGVGMSYDLPCDTCSFYNTPTGETTKRGDL
jgi:Ca2+-binding EF-hand superfamily protein